MNDIRIIFLTTLLSIVVYYSLGCTIELFEATCGCSTVNIRDGPSGKKLQCYPINVKSFFQTVHIPDDVIWIDFSENNEKQLSELTFGTNEHVLKYLLKIYQLDFSKNRIEKISANAFMPVRNLTRLNLSHNNIGNLTQDMFNGLSKLKVLDLSYNKFPIILGPVFKRLTSLTRVLLRSTDLVCNCLMRDFVIWMKNMKSVKVFGTCHLPKDGVKLRKLDPNKMICSANNITLPHFEMTPSSHQLVVQGDTIDILCEGTNLPNSRLHWNLNEIRLPSESETFSFKTLVNHYRSIITGWLTVKNVTTAHTGLWSCTVESPYSTNTKSMRWIVIKKNAQYCKKDQVVNNHGTFTWPSTIEGVTKNLQCGSKDVFATRLCQRGGWVNANYIDCPFSNFVTNEIHTTSTLMANSKSQNKASLLKNLMVTLKNKPITEKLALNFLNEMLIEQMQSLTPKDKDTIGQALLDLGSYLMKTNTSLLREAEFRLFICKRIVGLIINYNIKSKRVAALIEEESENIAIRAVQLDDKAQLVSEMTCAISENKVKLQVFCHNDAIRTLQSSILLPQTVLDTCTKTSGPYKIYFIAYRNGKLFQQTSLSTSIKSNVTIPKDLSSEMVFQVNIYGCTPKNLSDPIVFNFATKKKGSHYPAVWTPDGWKKDDACSAVCVNKNFTQVFCYKFATVTLIYERDSSADGTNDWSLIGSTHPAILAATIILIFCLLSVMVYYRFYAERLCVDKESRHMIISICFHMLVAACLFAFCVRLSRNRTICIICGLVLHYASLAVLFWITLSVRNILRQLITLTKPPALEPRPPKPMLRFYLIGCGIPLIICGITAAAKLENYGGEEEYCWLTWETSIYAFYLPAAFVALVCIFYLLRVLCTFNQQLNHGSNSSPVIGHSWPQDKRINSASSRYQAISASEPCRCSEYLNHSRADSPIHHHLASCPLRPTEQICKNQIVGTAVLFVFYLFTWVAAALSIAVPDAQPTVSVDRHCMKIPEGYSHQRISYDAFSWLYAILAISIGVFALVRSLLLRKGCRSRFMKCIGHDTSHDDDAGSTSSVSKLERLDDANLDHLTSSYDKSLPTGNKKHRGYPTIKTDPTSETLLESTDIVENLVGDSTPLYQDSFLKRQWNSGLAENCEPCMIHGNNRIMNSSSSLQKSFIRGQYSHNDSRSHAKDSARRAQFSHHHHSHDACGMDPRGYHAEAVPYHHIGYHNHHVSHHHDHGKMMKMTNLHNMAPDSSMTDHSLDDGAFNNMHTVPVIMQNHSQAKVNNSAMVDRYQKMRRALEKKRARQRKLNVLREYAQDPLTSNDEGKTQLRSKTDFTSPIESIPLVGGVPDADANQQSGNQSFRLLLISPTHKRSDKIDKSRSSGPNKRLKRLQMSGQNPVRAENRSKCRKNRGSISSEREQDTISGKSHQDGFKTIEEKSPLLVHPLEGSPSSVVAQSSATKGQGVHGYMTLQQLQTAGDFLFPSKNISVTGTLPTTIDATLPSAFEQGHVNTIESSQNEPQTNETTL